MFFSPIQQLSQVFDSWQQTRVSIGRIAELMRLHTITPDAVDPVPLGDVRGELALLDVHFTYPQAEVYADERGPADQVPTGRRGRPPQAAGGAARPRPAHRGPRDRRAGGRDRRRQVDGPQADRPLLRPRLRDASPSTGTTCAPCRCTTSAAGSATCRRSRSSSPGASATTSPTAGPRRQRRRGRGRRTGRRCPRPGRDPARRLPPRDLRARHVAVLGPATADRARPRRAGRPRGAPARRGDRQPRPRDRGQGLGRDGRRWPGAVRRS